MNIDYLFKTGEPPKKLVSIVDTDIFPSSSESLAPSADQYALILIKTQDSYGDSNPITVTIGGVVVLTNISSEVWNGEQTTSAGSSSGSGGLTPFIGGKGETVSVSGLDNLRHTVCFMLLEDD